MDDIIIHDEYLLTARQYNELYCKAFAALDQAAALAEQAMRDLEELQLSMAGEGPSGRLVLLPHRGETEETGAET